MASGLAICIIIAIIYKEPFLPFLITILISVFLSLISFFLSKKIVLKDLTKKEAYFSVSASWLLIALLGMIPYSLSGFFPSFVDAFFESVSGFTTTGSSILTDIEKLPKSILFWRSLTHWIGGIGIIVLVIVVMPAMKINNYSIFYLESSLREKIHPRIRSVGFRLLGVYIALTIVEVVFLQIGNMNLFESVCHAFGSVSTGGFSPKNTSIGGYSPYIQYVITVFMFLGGTNFILHYYAFQGQFTKIKDNDEFRFYIKVIVIAGLVIAAILYYGSERSIELSIRESFFQVVSIVTCTGFATTDYLLWPGIAGMIMFLLMFFGGSTGSTAGGIKMARHLIAIKALKNRFSYEIHSNSVFAIHLNHKIVNQNDLSSIFVFIYWYMLAFVTGSIVLIFLGLDIMTAASSIATAMGGIGPGFGTVGPNSNFAHLPDTVKIVISFFMILGRLEIYPVLILFSPGYWKK
jgi:trk system potassium uptake protein TrkH